MKIKLNETKQPKFIIVVNLPPPKNKKNIIV